MTIIRNGKDILPYKLRTDRDKLLRVKEICFLVGDKGQKYWEATRKELIEQYKELLEKSEKTRNRKKKESQNLRQDEERYCSDKEENTAQEEEPLIFNVNTQQEKSLTSRDDDVFKVVVL